MITSENLGMGKMMLNMNGQLRTIPKDGELLVKPFEEWELVTRQLSS